MRQRKRIGMAPVRIKFLPDEFEVSAPSGLRLIRGALREEGFPQ